MSVRQRPLGPFSTIICRAIGHEWERSNVFYAECERCWKATDDCCVDVVGGST